MPTDHITFLSYAGSSILFAALTIVLSYSWLKFRTIPPILIAAAACSALSHLLVAFSYSSTKVDADIAKSLELARTSLWIAATLASVNKVFSTTLKQNFTKFLHLAWITIFALSLSQIWLSGQAENIKIYTWSELGLAIIGIVSVEQLYKNAQASRTTRLLSIFIAAIFSYDIYLFTHNLIFGDTDTGLLQARGAINGLAAFLMAISVLATNSTSQQPSKIVISRPLIFYATSLTVAGCFLTIMSVGGYYIQIYGGNWGAVLQALLITSALISIAIVLTSNTARNMLSVWINKNFFHHKYDYRVEWLRLIDSLSRPTERGDFHQRAIATVASIFKSPGGGLWLSNGDTYRLTCKLNMPLPPGNYNEVSSSAFINFLRDNEWVFSPNSPDNKPQSNFNQSLPEWTLRIPNLWLVLPLLTESQLAGFIVLTKPNTDTSLTWEDLDLLKTVGRQVASYLHRHEAAELLAESRQFDAFNKLTAFIMHDLKNLIAQQALVVQNAAKHKENPAFVEDAIQTINNSVNRMNGLLKKLQQNEPTESRCISLHKALVETVKKCQSSTPTPSLRMECEDIEINADFDRLIMTLTHVVQNAQEATPPTGFVDVILSKLERNAVIRIEDNGKGMNEEFIQNHLFKPFETTKSGKGMGIGAYQTKEFIAALGGKVAVDSTVGEGTTFTITIPIS